MLHSEMVLRARFIGMNPLRMDVQTPMNDIYVLDGKRHVTQAHQTSGASFRIAARAITQRPMHRHRLRAVLCQMHGMQTLIAAQRMVGVPVCLADGVNGSVVPRYHGIQQAHGALVRDEVLPVSLGEHAEPSGSKDRSGRRRPGSR